MKFFYNIFIEFVLYSTEILNLIINLLPSILKKLFLKTILKKFSLNCLIDQNIFIRNPINLSISSNCNINRGCEFFTAFQNYKNGSIELEENVTLSPNVKIYAIAQDPHSKSFNSITKPVLIKKNVWICADVTILPGVTIGENAVIASKSIVNKSVNANEIWGGNPAKYIKKRNNSIKI
jgi:acetyltransferase-like isoleucine patch superfamily enzyme